MRPVAPRRWRRHGQGLASGRAGHRSPGRALALALAVVALSSAAATGCGSVPPDPPGPGGIELGTIDNDGRWLTLTPGQDVELAPGAQGGFHVWMKLRLHDAPPGHLNMEKRAYRESDGKLVLRASGWVDVGAADPQGMWEQPAAMPMFMCPSPIGISVIDVRIRFEVTLTGEDGAPVMGGQIPLVPHCPDGEQRGFCMHICTG